MTVCPSSTVSDGAATPALLQVHDDGLLHLVAGAAHPEADDVERHRGHDLEHRQLAQALLEMLGDPAAALDGGRDPVRAERLEA